MNQSNWNFICFRFSESNIYSIKIIQFWYSIWKFQNSTKLSPSVPERLQTITIITIMIKLLIIIIIIIIIIIRVFCPRAGPSLQAQEPRLQFCRKQVFHRKLRNQGCSFTRDWIRAVASRCFPHPTHSLASEETLKDLKIYQEHQCGGEESWFS